MSIEVFQSPASRDARNRSRTAAGAYSTSGEHGCWVTDTTSSTIAIARGSSRASRVSLSSRSSDIRRIAGSRTDSRKVLCMGTFTTACGDSQPALAWEERFEYAPARQGVPAADEINRLGLKLEKACRPVRSARSRRCWPHLLISRFPRYREHLYVRNPIDVAVVAVVNSRTPGSGTGMGGQSSCEVSPRTCRRRRLANCRPPAPSAGLLRSAQRAVPVAARESCAQS